MVCGARFENFAKSRVEVVLFLVAKDAARESWKVVGSGEEAGYPWDVDYVCANVQGEWEREGFHFGVFGCWLGCLGSCCEGEVVGRRVAAELRVSR